MDINLDNLSLKKTHYTRAEHLFQFWICPESIPVVEIFMVTHTSLRYGFSHTLEESNKA